jgi:hypothetical protein
MPPTLAELMVSQAFDSTDPHKINNTTQAFASGAQIAMQAQAVKQKNAQIAQEQEQLQMQKFEKVGSWIDTAAKMPDGPAKKAFMKNYFPNGVKALGLSDHINPYVMEMFQGDPNLGSYVAHQIRTGKTNMSILNSPDGVAGLAASPEYQQFGGLDALKGAIDDNRVQLEKAQADRIQDEEAANNARTMANQKGGERVINNTEDLRKELNNHDVTKKTQGLADSYDKINIAFGGKPSPAGDMSGVFAYMKMLDPASTVREGEQAQARNAAGVPDQVRNMYNKLLNGETLTAGQRKDFLGQATKLYRSQYAKQMKLNDKYAGAAKAQRLDPKLITFGAEFKAPPEEKKTGAKVKVGGKEYSVEDAKRFFDANPAAKEQLDAETKKALGY